MFLSARSVNVIKKAVFAYDQSIDSETVIYDINHFLHLVSLLDMDANFQNAFEEEGFGEMSFLVADLYPVMKMVQVKLGVLSIDRFAKYQQDVGVLAIIQKLVDYGKWNNGKLHESLVRQEQLINLIASQTN